MKNQLRAELRSVGATNAELDELVALAGDIRQLGKIRSQLPKRRLWPILVPVALASLAVGIVIMVAAQAALPGNILYPIQKISDNVAIAVHPEYRAVVMMRRAQQVKQLVAAHASSHVVLTALDDYQAEASVYKTTSNSYAAFEFCKVDLRQALTISTGPDHDAISGVLKSLDTV